MDEKNSFQRGDADDACGGVGRSPGIDGRGVDMDLLGDTGRSDRRMAAESGLFRRATGSSGGGLSGLEPSNGIKPMPVKAGVVGDRIDSGGAAFAILRTVFFISIGGTLLPGDYAGGAGVVAWGARDIL